MRKQTALPAWITRVSAAVIVLSGIIPYTVQAGQALKATCSFKQTRMPCTVTISNGTWKIKWQDGVSDTYREIGNGDLKDARGGVWRLYSRHKHTYLEHTNGNIIDIFY